MTTSGSESTAQGLDSNKFSCLPGSFDVHTARGTRQAVAAVLAERLGNIHGPQPVLVLVGTDAVIVDVYRTDLADRQIPMDLTIGQDLSIDCRGTNAIGLAVENRAPAQVVGPHHDHHALSGCRTCAVPLRSARTGRVLATLGLVSTNLSESSMELPWLGEIATRVEDVLALGATRRESLLLHSFITANRNCRQLVIALGDGFAIGNDAAHARLSGSDLAQLRVAAADITRSGEARIRPMVLSDGTATSMSVNQVIDGTTPVGAVARIRLPTANLASESPMPAIGLPGLVGHSAAWSHFCMELSRASLRSLLLIGATGTGKSTTARALMDQRAARGTSVDCSTWCLGEETAWLRALRQASSHPTILVEHIDRLPKGWYGSTAAEFRRLADRGVAIVATATIPEGIPAPPVTNEWFETVLQIPSLRSRIDDLPLLLAALSERYTENGGPPPRWMPDAIQALAGMAWSRNVRGLEAIVRETLRKSGQSGYIGAANLPPHVLARSTRRHLARLEHSEMTTILLTLRECGGNKRMAAETLGIARSTLHRKLRSMGVFASVPPE